VKQEVEINRCIKHRHAQQNACGAKVATLLRFRKPTWNTSGGDGCGTCRRKRVRIGVWRKFGEGPLDPPATSSAAERAIAANSQSKPPFARDNSCATHRLRKSTRHVFPVIPKDFVDGSTHSAAVLCFRCMAVRPCEVTRTAAGFQSNPSAAEGSDGGRARSWAPRSTETMRVAPVGEPVPPRRAPSGEGVVLT